MPRLYVPSALRELTDGQSDIELDGQTVGDMLQSLESKHPGTSSRLTSSETAHGLRHGLVVFIDGEQFRTGTRTKVDDNSTVYLVLAQAGGT